MRKLTIYLLVACYLFSGTPLRELLKVPVLVQHFQEHKALNPQITFAQFINEHYSNIPHTDNDEDRDNQLPFKLPGANSVSPAIPSKLAIDLRKPVRALITNEPYPANDSLIPAGCKGKIWQPPKA